MDKKTLFVIIFTVIFMIIAILIVVKLIGGVSPYVDTFLDKLNKTVAHWFNRTFGT